MALLMLLLLYVGFVKDVVVGKSGPFCFIVHVQRCSHQALCSARFFIVVSNSAQSCFIAVPDYILFLVRILTRFELRLL